MKSVGGVSGGESNLRNRTRGEESEGEEKEGHRARQEKGSRLSLKTQPKRGWGGG